MKKLFCSILALMLLLCAAAEDYTGPVKFSQGKNTVGSITVDGNYALKATGSASVTVTGDVSAIVYSEAAVTAEDEAYVRLQGDIVSNHDNDITVGIKASGNSTVVVGNKGSKAANTIEVTGCDTTGVYTEGNASVTLQNVDITSDATDYWFSNPAVGAQGAGGSMDITGDISVIAKGLGYGVKSENDADISVTGDITVTSTKETAYGVAVNSADGAQIAITGDISAEGCNAGIGLAISDTKNSSVTIDGVITAQTGISIDESSSNNAIKVYGIAADNEFSEDSGLEDTVEYIIRKDKGITVRSGESKVNTAKEGDELTISAGGREIKQKDDQKITYEILDNGDGTYTLTVLRGGFLWFVLDGDISDAVSFNTGDTLKINGYGFIIASVSFNEDTGRYEFKLITSAELTNEEMANPDELVSKMFGEKAEGIKAAAADKELCDKYFGGRVNHLVVNVTSEVF